MCSPSSPQIMTHRQLIRLSKSVAIPKTSHRLHRLSPSLLHQCEHSTPLTTLGSHRQTRRLHTFHQLHQVSPSLFHQSEHPTPVTGLLGSYRQPKRPHKQFSLSFDAARISSVPPPPSFIDSGDNEEDVAIPDPPTNCCMSGCANCVWLDYAEELAKLYSDGGRAAEKVLKAIEDPSLRIFMSIELREKLKAEDNEH